MLTAQRFMLAITVFTVTSLISCFVVPKEPEKIDFPEISTGEIKYDVREVKREDLVNSVITYGYFEPAVKERLFFKYAGGRLSDLYVEQDDMVTKGQTLATLNISGLENQIKLQEIALQKAELRLKLLTVSNANAFEVQMARLDVEAAQIRSADLQEKLDNNSIKAPFDGEITFVGAEEGDYVEPFVPVLSIVNDDELIFECDPERARHLREDMEVEIEVDDIKYRGVVVQTYEDILFLGENALKENKVQIDVFDVPESMERGELGRLEIILEESHDTISVQKSDVHTFGQRTFVYVLRNGIKVEQDIAVGLQTRTKVEVTEGLEDGDLVIIR
ncbi:MAG: hypothetical protein CMN78_00945 [Spirochaetales bacterium]|nr:hypothetical protein [Spirochaetales bacterium]